MFVCRSICIDVLIYLNQYYLSSSSFFLTLPWSHTSDLPPVVRFRPLLNSKKRGQPSDIGLSILIEGREI